MFKILGAAAIAVITNALLGVFVPLPYTLQNIWGQKMVTYCVYEGDAFEVGFADVGMRTKLGSEVFSALEKKGRCRNDAMPYIVIWRNNETYGTSRAVTKISTVLTWDAGPKKRYLVEKIYLPLRPPERLSDTREAPFFVPP